MDLPPLGLSAVAIAADGSETIWWSGDRYAGNRPQGLSFRTKRGEGFADSQLTLARRIDRDYRDINLLDDFVLVGDDGAIAYEGRLAANPRSLGEESHQISVVTQGWMSHSRDRKFCRVYVDADLSAWQTAPLHRRATLGGVVSFGDLSPSTDAGALVLDFPTNAIGATRTGQELWYTMPAGDLISKVEFVASKAGTTTLTGWADGEVDYATDDDGTTGAGSLGSINFDGALHATPFTTPTRFGYIKWDSNGNSVTPAAGTNRTFAALAAYGNSGIDTHPIDATTPDGVYASEVIEDILASVCPRLSADGVQATSYPIPQLVFKDRTHPYDAFLEVNKYHLWDFGVYDDKTFYYRPFDFTDYDWEVRLSDYGVTVDLQGDSVGQDSQGGTFANGICVEYTALPSGRTEVITPDDNPALRDPDPTNPANSHGLEIWTEVTLSSPTITPVAADLGRALLAEYNQPKAPGTIRVTGHIRDRAGHWQQVWKVRAGDRIAITDHPDDRPRSIVETNYQHDSKTIDIAVDNTFMRVGAVLDRIATALRARNLSL